MAPCIESYNLVEQFLLLVPEWDTVLSQVTPSITSRFPLRHQIGLLGGKRHWETAGLYQIQNEVEVRTAEGYALSRGKEVQFCLCLVSACLRTSNYQDRISIPQF